MNVADQMDEEAERGRLLEIRRTIHYSFLICVLLVDTLDELVQLQDDILLFLSILHFRPILFLNTEDPVQPWSSRFE